MTYRESRPAPLTEEQIAKESIERYSGSTVEAFQEYLLLTNFPKYVDYFASEHQVPIFQGSTLKVAHSPKDNISIVDFKIGSPAAALVVDLCSFLPVKASLMLGMCGGLRRHYQIGEYFVPIASIRGEGTSDFYFPPEVPALANFTIQKAVTEILESTCTNYHIGITHTTNIRFWEFSEEFKEHLRSTRAQAIEMECATLFSASYRRHLPLGSLLLISDLPLRPHGIKTKKSSEGVFEKYTADHVDKGVLILKEVQKMQAHHVKGTYRGSEDEQTSLAPDLPMHPSMSSVYIEGDEL